MIRPSFLFAGLFHACLSFFIVKELVVPIATARSRNPFQGQPNGIQFQALGALFGFIIASSICALLDYVSWVSGKDGNWKIQGRRAIFSVEQYTSTTIHSLVNMIFFSWIAILPTFFLQTSAVLNRRVNSPDFPIDMTQAAIDTCIHAVVIEVWFYSTHRLLHWPPLYKVCVYLSGFEFTVY